jgi:hypothetical protein
MMVVAYYIVGAALAAWMTTGNGHLDWKLSLLVLPTMYLAHVCYNAIAGGTTSQSRACLACQSDIGLFRRLAHHRFCCDNHEAMYLAELQELAVTRLHNAIAAASWEPSEPILRREVNMNRENHAVSTPVPPGQREQTQALIVRPKLAGFKPSPAYHLAEP